MGGGGGDTTNVTNTGLGDDQYQTLADNQVGISDQITTSYDDATKRYDTFDTRFGTLDTNVGDIGTNLTGGFTNLQDLMKSYNTATNTQFDTVNANTAGNATALTTANQNLNNLQTDLTGGFNNVGQRFDTVDQSNTNLQTTVDQGFVDQAQGFTDQANNMSTGFANAGTALSTGLSDTNTNITNAADAANTQLNTVQTNVLEGQRVLDTNLGTLTSNVDAYSTQSLGNQDTLQQGQDTFKSNFDDYVGRYGTDTTLANQTRADLQTAQANSADRIREDVGKYAQATATGQGILSEQLGGGLSDVAATVTGGFNQTAADQAAFSQNLATRIGSMKNQLTTTGDRLDANTKAQYEALSSAFDENGTLITSAIDTQGNTISRSFDDQGSIIENKFDSAGKQIGSVSMNVETMLSNAETYAEQTSSQLKTGFSEVDQGQQGLMQSTQQAFGDNSNSLQQMMGTIQTGFDSTDQTMSRQIKDMAGITSGMTDLDMGMRQNFKQMGDAFDDNGKLIQSSIDENGNTVTRAIDKSGNLLLRQFDVTGRAMGDKVVNINKALNDLSTVKNLPGANVSMGNLSPAMQGNVPTGGFMSPYSQTRA
jgi:hypothetical protein